MDRKGGTDREEGAGRMGRADNGRPAYPPYPRSHTLYPKPYTLYPKPYTLYPKPYTLYPKPYTLYPKPYTLTPINYALALVLLLLLGVAGCGGRSATPAYSPHENLLSIAAEFELLASRDPYREPVSRDLTGQAIHRATLLRLGAYEELHPGRLAPEVLVYKARALELLGDYMSARRHYEDAAEYDTELRGYANSRVQKLDRLLVALAPPPATNDLMEVLLHLEDQGRELRELAATFDEPLYRSLAMREAEEAEVRRAEMMAVNRFLLPDGERQAQLAFEELVANHRRSARAMEHALRLARYHRELAEEEVRLNPPERLGFSADRFRRHYEAASDLLYRISQADGRPERLVARHELDAVLALGEEVARRAR